MSQEMRGLNNSDNILIGLLNLMVLAKLAKSNGEARRLVRQGAVRINDEKISDERAEIKPEDGMIIRSGKRGFAKVVIK